MHQMVPCISSHNTFICLVVLKIYNDVYLKHFGAINKSKIEGQSTFVKEKMKSLLKSNG